ncbi:MAG: RNA-binding transcriptional accessory protein [Candidatus Eisenbacteria sp.]|nr:RNA-binding transcriptional accessory protein [Candidatus Eisenbacteria bacterium]
MNETHITRIAEELDVLPGKVQAAAALLDDGATVPFIARYRKEATGSLDEVAITTIRDRLHGLRELDKRCEAILKSLAERELLTPELKTQIAAADTLATLEDIYLPYRPRRRTRATIAREKGLELLARLLLDSPAEPSLDPIAEAAAFVNEEKGVATADDALAGARDIIAETISEDARARMAMRALYSTRGVIKSKVVKGQEDPGAKYKDYFEWEEPLPTAPSHRVLAMRRGEKETFLSLKIEPPEEMALAELHRLFVVPHAADSRGGAPEPDSPAAQQLTLAVANGYKRLLAPAMTTEMWTALKRRADDEAIRVFAGNLRELLLAPPLGQKHVLAIDPGFRTGCKLVCLDEQGKLIHSDTIYPHAGEARAQAARETLRKLCRRFDIEAIAIGNGTAGRETDAFVRGLKLPAQTIIVMVNESGASIYSASEAAREEFPDHDLTVRGAVSIGRRLMDPLAELIKIEPKSIGVGQYQHDVDQGALRRALDDVVMSCVNAVGVDLNTASKQLLTYVSGFGPQLAQNIVAFRDEHGPFATRRKLTKVPRLGPKAFEQAAGFLRIRNGKNPLDASAVHPECYPVVAAIATDLGCQAKDLMRDSSLRDRIDLKRYVTEKVGLPTLRDIRAELAIPGRDPREEFEAFSFTEDINSIEDIKVGLTLSGLVTNVTAFGAFVDIGIHQDGLVHISQLADRFVRDPAEVVKVQQKVTVRVIGVDLERKRISLSMKSAPERNE